MSAVFPIVSVSKESGKANLKHHYLCRGWAQGTGQRVRNTEKKDTVSVRCLRAVGTSEDTVSVSVTCLKGKNFQPLIVEIATVEVVTLNLVYKRSDYKSQY